MPSRILAIGGGGFLMEDAPSPIDRYIAEAASSTRPKICFISTPSGDSVDMIDKFYAAYEVLGCEATHLAFFRKPFRASLPLAGFEKHLLAQDVIFVGGGNTKSALGVWREWNLDEVLRQVWRAGTLLSGMSAGALCWFEEGLTDSYWARVCSSFAVLGSCPADAACITEVNRSDASGCTRRSLPATSVIGSHRRWRCRAVCRHVDRQSPELVSWCNCLSGAPGRRRSGRNCT